MIRSGAVAVGPPPAESRWGFLDGRLHAILLCLSCGTERGDVLVLNDPGAGKVDLVAPWRGFCRPASSARRTGVRDSNPRCDLEQKVFFVTAYVLAHKQEKEDGDFYLIIADDPNEATGTMIAELPAPEFL